MGFTETIFLLFLALLIFGPKKLPEVARQLGKMMNEFKRASNEFRSQIETEISQLETEGRRQILPPAEPPAGALNRQAPVLEAAAVTPSNAADANSPAKVPPDA